MENSIYRPQDIEIIKRKYNEVLKRNDNAEIFFKKSPIEECMKYLNLFNEVVEELSGLIEIIEGMTGEIMDHETKIKGF